jgi:Family of unknown function (DUF5317)
MILVVAALACVVSVPLSGGHLVRLTDLRLRLGGLALGVLALQVAITTLVPNSSRGVLELLHVASYVLAGVCIFANRRITGLPIMALGTALNFLAIALNHGVMPASARAMHIAGLATGEGFQNSTPVDDPHLLALGDVIPVPGPWPLANVLSVGDLLIIVGLLFVLHRSCRVPRVPLPESTLGVHDSGGRGRPSHARWSA